MLVQVAAIHLTAKLRFISASCMLYTCMTTFVPVVRASSPKLQLIKTNTAAVAGMSAGVGTSAPLSRAGRIPGTHVRPPLLLLMAVVLVAGNLQWAAFHQRLQ